MEYYCLTDIGLLREKNQDSYFTGENIYGDFLMVVADGIGGGKAGEVASNEVVKYFEDNFKDSGEFKALKDLERYLEYHLDKVNMLVYHKSLSNYQYRGMGTTITGVLVSKLGVLTFNCGDSRVYGFKNELNQLTYDHSLVNQMLAKKQITYEESINHPKRNYLVKAIGIFEKIKCDIKAVENYPYYLVCSDGLHGYVSKQEIEEILKDELSSIEDKCLKLKDLALLKGGYDNITVGLIRL